jgi:hypothetical protein
MFQSNLCLSKWKLLETAFQADIKGKKSKIFALLSSSAVRIGTTSLGG